MSINELRLKFSAAVNPLLRRLRIELVPLTISDDLLREEVPPELGNLSMREQMGIVAVATPAEVSIEEGRFLGELVGRGDSSRPIIEIGTLFGHSTTILTLFKDPDQPLIGVDNFSWNPLGLSPKVHEYMTRKVLEQGTDKYNVTVKNIDKQAFFDSYDGPPPALVFCDADHSTEATLADIEWARSVGAEIVCGHDYGEDPRVSVAVDSLGGPKELVGRLFVV